MLIEREIVGDVAVLTLKGKMLIGEADEMLREEIRRLKKSTPYVLLDFQEVPHIDSAALCEVVRAYTTMSRKDGTVALLNLNGRIDDLLSLTKLKQVFPIFTSKAQALEAFRDGTWEQFTDQL